MFWHNYCMVFILVCLQMVYSQVTVSYDSVPVECGDQLELKCTYTGGHNCCRASTRLWLINITQILSDGASTPTGKYTEKIDDINKEFSLLINDIQDSDFDKEYKCSYAVTTSQPYRLEKRGDFSCTDPTPPINVTCLECAAICLGVGTGIQVPGFLIIILVLLTCCPTTFAWLYAVGVPVVYSILIYIETSLLTIPIGYFECPCRENFTWISFVTLCFATSLIATWIVCYSIFDWIYLHEIFSEKNPKDKIKICCIGYISGGVSFFISSWSNSKWFQGTGSKDAPFKVYVKLGCEAVLKYKDKDVKMQWAKSVVEGWKTIEPFEKKKYKVSATSAFFKNKYHRLHVVGTQPDDEGIYKCTAEPEKEYHFQLILKSHEDCPWKLWLYFGGLMMLIILIFPIPFLSIYYCCWEGDDTSFCKKVLRYSGIVMLTILIFPIPLLIVYFYCLKGEEKKPTLL